MTPETIFSAANAVALAAWVLLAALPGRRWVTGVLCRLVVPAAFAVVYAIIVATRLAGADGGFSSLPDVARLFADPWLLLAGWLHYLAFDLLVGNWEVRDARTRGLPHALVLPCLGLTFLLGPVGWLLYVAIRTWRANSASAAPVAASVR